VITNDRERRGRLGLGLEVGVCNFLLYEKLAFLWWIRVKGSTAIFLKVAK
jgi:hypothetical protein